MTDIVRQMKINVTCTSIKSLQHKCSDCDVEITRLPNLQHLFTLYVANCAHNFVIDGPVLTKLQLKELKLAMDPSSRTRECMAAVSAYLKKSMDETRSDYFSVCVCLCVCSRAYLRNYTSDIHRTFVHVTCGWLGPSLAALRYVTYFRFYG